MELKAIPSVIKAGEAAISAVTKPSVASSVPLVEKAVQEVGDSFTKQKTYDDVFEEFANNIAAGLTAKTAKEEGSLVSRVKRFFRPENQPLTTTKREFTDAEFKSISHYVSNYGISGGSARYNRAARPCEILDNLSTAVENSTLSRDTVLYRGVKGGEVHNYFDDYAKEGAIPVEELTQMKKYLSRGFTSTATSADSARNYGFSNGVMFRIHAPKGTKGLEIDQHAEQIRDWAKRTGNMNSYIETGLGKESEVLLPMNTQMKVLGYEKHPVPKKNPTDKQKYAYIFDMKIV